VPPPALIPSRTCPAPPSPCPAPQAYLAGDWPAARAGLEALPTRPSSGGGPPREDGPARVLLSFMGGHGFVAPAGWAGYRELTEK
jgi:hypothetical protein